MTRFRFGTLVLLGTATLTLAVAWLAMSPRVVCEPVAPVAVARPEPKVLYIESVAGTLVRTLGRELDVTSRTPAELPSSADKLARYDLVVLSDVPMHLLDAERIAALDAYVRGGGSLLVAGGADSLGSGGYEATALEKLLPARFDSGCRLDAPNLALVIVVDQSMRRAPMDKTREAIRALSESLAPNDYVAVIGFDDDAHTRVRAQRAANRRRIAEQLADLVPSERTGGLFAGLHAAEDILESIHAASKHVIVVAASNTSSADVVELTADMRARGITTSAVPFSDALPDLLARDAAKATVSDDENVHVRSPSRASALSVRDAPPLHGYVSMRTKPAAETLLVSNYNDEPLLARWCHDAGTVLVWTSDLDHERSREWVGWRGYASLWSRVIRTSARGASECSRSR
jgi:Ca-activated chloride channel homolog